MATDTSKTEQSFSMPYEGGLPQASIPKPFAAEEKEICFALLSFIIGWLYIQGTIHENIEVRPYFIMALALTLTVFAEIMYVEKKRTFESVMLLLCFLCCSFSLSLHQILGRIHIFPYPYTYDGIWEEGQVFFFVHIFFVWYVMSRSGKLLEGETGHLLPADAINGFAAIPIMNIFLRIRTLIFGVKSISSKKDEQGKKSFPWISVAAVLASAVVLIMAVSLLMQADETFDRIFSRMKDIFDIRFDEIFWFKLFLSIPVGGWLFSLVSGAYRYEDEKKDKSRQGILSFLETIKKVTPSLWTTVIAVFSVFYIIFFVIQGNYLFGAFLGKIPAGYIVSHYARKGFFELCKVTALNFFLLWMATRTANEEIKGSKGFKISTVVFLAESMLFAVIAISKLALYISSYGITPLRLQSSWFAAVLFTACALWMYSILTGKKVFKYWMYFGAISLAIMCIF